MFRSANRESRGKETRRPADARARARRTAARKRPLADPTGNKEVSSVQTQLRTMPLTAVSSSFQEDLCIASPIYKRNLENSGPSDSARERRATSHKMPSNHPHLSLAILRSSENLDAG